MSEKINVGLLKPHPRNNEFFDDMTGEKWDEFLESIRTSGVIEPIVVTPDGDGYTIVSGHQRTRACKELGKTEILCYIKDDYKNDDEILRDLIETNIKQRGSVGGSQLKLGRRVRELERIRNIKHGGDRTKTDNVGLAKQEDLAKEFGISVDVLQLSKRLATLPLEIQQMVEDGKISASTASRVIASLSPLEQEQLISSLDATAKYTQKQIESQLSSIRGQLEATQRDNDLLKSTNSDLARVNAELRNRKPEVREVVPEDYELIKSTNNMLVAKLKEADCDIKKLENDIKTYGADAEAHRKLTEELKILRQEQQSLSKSVEAADTLQKLYHKVDDMLSQDLAPVQFARCMEELDYNRVIRENGNALINRVRRWCDSAYEAFNTVNSEAIIEG